MDIINNESSSFITQDMLDNYVKNNELINNAQYMNYNNQSNNKFYNYTTRCYEYHNSLPNNNYETNNMIYDNNYYNNYYNIYNNYYQLQMTASLIFVDKNNNYLVRNQIKLINEYNKFDNSYITNLILSYYSYQDKDALYTAIKSFIIQTNIIAHPYFNVLNNNTDDLTLLFYHYLVSYVTYDLSCVSIKYNVYHVNYTINLENIPNDIFKKNIINLPIFTNRKNTSENNFEGDHIFWLEKKSSNKFKYTQKLLKYLNL